MAQEKTSILLYWDIVYVLGDLFKKIIQLLSRRQETFFNTSVLLLPLEYEKEIFLTFNITS